MVEGFTEDLFYHRVKDLFHRRTPAKIINLEGNWNINQKVLDEFENYQRKNPEKKFRVFIAIDRESRTGFAPINMATIREELCASGLVRHKDLVLFEAIQDIESWFFHDVEGIFRFLRLEQKHRVPGKYTPVESLNNRDMSKLFELADKDYRKGFASKNFIDNLDINLILARCPVLGELCKRMKETCPQ